MSNLKASLLALLLAVAALGCGSDKPPPRSVPPRPDSQPERPVAENTWVQSDDLKLEMRLSVVAGRVAVDEDIQVVAELRNASRQAVTVLRPFGDRYVAEAVGIKIWDAERRVRFSGPTPSYVIGTSGFAVLLPGESVEDKLVLVNANFDGIEKLGTYTLRYDYAYDGQWDSIAKAAGGELGDVWRGRITSREVQVVRE